MDSAVYFDIDVILAEQEVRTLPSYNRENNAPLPLFT